jgi:hypothetical protein
MENTRWRGLVVAAFMLVAACSPASDETAEDQAADTAAMMATPASDVSGTWNMRSVPESGSDTTSTLYQIQVADGVYTLLLPNRDPVTATVVTEGDSIVMNAPPFQSVRRQGMTVSTQSVLRVNGDQLEGYTIARYQGAGADSVLRLRTTGTRAQ